MRNTFWLVCFSFVVTACGYDWGGPGEPGGEAPPARFMRVQNPIADHYIVVLQDTMMQSSRTNAGDLVLPYNGKLGRVYTHALNGFSVTMTEADAKALAKEPSVRYVIEDGVVSINATQNGATWGLDRIDQNSLPLNSQYTYTQNGSGVNAYIVDTGIRVTHNEFGGRAAHGFSAINDGNGSNDCNGHGTHVAGTVGSATYGVAKNVNLFAVRVLDCGGSGSNSGVIAGIDWVAANAQLPAVANMSLGGGQSTAINNAVANATAAGVTFVVAAGNETTDACTKSPASAPSAITVASSTSSDSRSSFSNFGSCVDIFAPGSSITSTWNTNNSATNTISGTSMASPHVCGVAALYLDANPNATPSQVDQALTSNGSLNKISGVNGSPNILVYTGFIGGGGDVTPPSVTLTAPANGATVSGNVTLSANASDDTAVTQVSFLVDGQVVATDTSSPYSASWDSSSVVDGTHTVEAQAQDAAGNVGSDSASVTTQNGNTNEGNATYDSSLGAPACRGATNSCDSGTLLDGIAASETNAPNNLTGCGDGGSGSYHVDESVDRIRVFTNNSANFGEGAVVTVEVDVWAWTTFSADSLDLYATGDANAPSWTFIATLKPTASGAGTLSTTYTLPAGGLQAVRANFRYNGAASSCSTGNYDDHDDLVFAVAGTPDTTNPSVAIDSPSNGATVGGNVTIAASASDDRNVAKVEFFVDGTLLATDTTSPYSASWNTGGTSNGAHTILARATDTSNNSASASVGVTVDNTTGTGEASYDATLGAPVCSTVASSCDSGTLLDGVASSESNASNTLGSCADGTRGTYHVDESVDKINIATTGGGPLTAGAEVTVTVTVWAWSTGSSDRLDVYYTGNANAPSWTLLGTGTPSGGGQRTLSGTYVLPAGGLQAVRTNFRYNGSASSCSPGSYDDHDDLVFATQ